jgi:RNA polymerase-associated protein RTF1
MPTNHSLNPEIDAQIRQRYQDKYKMEAAVMEFNKEYRRKSLENEPQKAPGKANVESDVHDFDVTIDLEVPAATNVTTAKPSDRMIPSAPRRSLNLADYKKRKGLI